MLIRLCRRAIYKLKIFVSKFPTATAGFHYDVISQQNVFKQIEANAFPWVSFLIVGDFQQILSYQFVWIISY